MRETAKSTPVKSRFYSGFILGALIAVIGLFFWDGYFRSKHSSTSTDQLPEAFRQGFEKFIAEGSRLNSLTKQGVSIDSYGEQLATTAAAFDVLDSLWPSGYETTAQLEFQSALSGWKLLYRFWRMEISKDNSLPSTNDRSIIDALEAYAPGRIKHNGNGAWFGNSADERLDSSFIPYRPNIRIIMGIASDYFVTARTRVQKTTTGPRAETRSN